MLGESFLLSSLITSFSTLSMGALVLAVIVHLTALLLFLNIDKLEKGGCSQSKDAKAQIWNRHMEFLEPKQPTDETGLCPACGRTISSVDNFCLRCGHNLHADQALAPTAPPWAAPVCQRLTRTRRMSRTVVGNWSWSCCDVTFARGRSSLGRQWRTPLPQ